MKAQRIIGLVASFVAWMSLFSDPAQAQRRVDLGDMEIKGALHGDGQLNLIGRQRNELRNHVQYRENFRPEMQEGLIQQDPEVFYSGPKLTRPKRQ